VANVIFRDGKVFSSAQAALAQSKSGSFHIYWKEAIDMIRKAHNLDPTAMDPTPEDIRRRTAAIRKSWTPRERVRRSGIRRISWTPPIFSEADLAGFGGDFESR
jgi:hypothetical protein